MTLLSESLSSKQSGSAPDIAINDNHETDPRERGRDLTQSYDNLITQNNPPKTLITQQFRTDLGQSVGVTTATQLVWLNQFTGSQLSHHSELWPNAIFQRQCLSIMIFQFELYSFDFCSKFYDL